MKKLRIVSRIVHREDISKERGFLCVDVDRAMKTFEEGFKKMEPLREIYPKTELISKIKSGHVEVVNGELNETNNDIKVINNLKGKNVLISDTFRLVGNLEMPLMLIGKMVYQDKTICYRVSNGLGSVSEISYANLVSMVVESNRTIVNGKILKKDGKCIVSCIRGDLPVRTIKE